MCTLKKTIYSLLYVVGFLFLTVQCRQEIPITACITVDAESLSQPANPALYGISLDELNHSIDGGIYAELIRNRSFEDGVAPANCPYDRTRNVLFTPNGWTVPFYGDSLTGWHKLSASTQIVPDRKELINETNRQSLYVGVYETAVNGRGGVVAEGFNGIRVCKGDKYDLSFYLKSATISPRTIHVALETPDGKQILSDVYRVSTTADWQRLNHTFTATGNADDAVLTISTDSTATFWLDMVSLFPQKTWNNRKNGFRQDIMEMIAALNPRFVRFPGGEVLEGYTAGSFPEWKESIGDIALRKNFWNIYGYGSTNGAGFHEYLQLCEDLKAEPVFVVNSGVTSQSRRPRYEDITAMDALTQNVLDAIEYANAPADSTWGALRAKNGHPAPFNLKYVEVGNENSGSEYLKRFELFKKAIAERYPDIMVIASDYNALSPGGWVDRHFNVGETFFLSHHNYFEPEGYAPKFPPVCIYAFSVADDVQTATLGRAVAEACFMIGMERSVQTVKQAAYSPLLSNTGYVAGQPAAINFNHHQVMVTPSYHLLQLFMNNRGDQVLKTDVTSYQKPQVTFGASGIYLFDNTYDITDVMINSGSGYTTSVKEGQWNVPSAGVLVPAPNKWNYVLIGDTAAYNYTLTAKIKRTKGSSPIQFNLRDNGALNERRNHITCTLGTDVSNLIYNVGKTSEVLSSHKLAPFENNAWYDVKFECKDDTIRCYINNNCVHEYVMRTIPSLVSVATLDKKNNDLLLKVVNTTFRMEKTSIDFKGINVKKEAIITQLGGDRDLYNSYTSPETVTPVSDTVAFFGTLPLLYSFPPNSITLMRFKVN